MTDTPDTADHLLKLRPDGSVTLPNGTTLMPPKIGVLKTLAIAEETVTEQMAERGLELQPEIAKLTTRLLQVIAVQNNREPDEDGTLMLADGTEVETPIPKTIRDMTAPKLAAERTKLNKELTQIRRDFAAEQMGARLGWLRICYAECANGAEPMPADDDDCEVWMSHMQLGRAVLNNFEGLPISPFGQ